MVYAAEKYVESNRSFVEEKSRLATLQGLHKLPNAIPVAAAASQIQVLVGPMHRADAIGSSGTQATSDPSRRFECSSPLSKGGGPP